MTKGKVLLRKSKSETKRGGGEKTRSSSSRLIDRSVRPRESVYMGGNQRKGQYRGRGGKGLNE